MTGRGSASSSIALEGATPRDIQTRVRHGQSPEQIAEQTGIALERVERFSGPPLAEREHVAARARETEVRRPEGDAALAELVLAVLAAGGIDDKTLEWDSWRREDGPWSVVATWAGGTDDLAAGSATWTFDNADRSLAPDDAAARVLLGGTPPPSRRRGCGLCSPTTAPTTSTAPRPPGASRVLPRV